jgi:hypothetical protein
VTPNEKSTAIGASIVSFVVGGAISYFATRKVLTTRFEKLVDKELREAKEYYIQRPPQKVSKKDQKKVSKKDQKKLVKKLEYVGDDTPEIPRGESYLDMPDEVVVEGSDPHFNYAVELPRRSKEYPYVIHVDEFLACEKDYDQVSITYYEGDDILADEKDVPIPKPDEIVGESNLLRFGHGSKDNRVVYVRNEILELEFEILHRDGKFSREVLGFIEHSEPRGRPRKFRSDNE